MRRFGTSILVATALIAAAGSAYAQSRRGAPPPAPNPTTPPRNPDAPPPPPPVLPPLPPVSPA